MTAAVAVRERPLLMSGPMVRAILDDRKTQTRRVVKPQPEWLADAWYWRSRRYDNGDGAQYFHTATFSRPLLEEWARACPYGQPGDRLWVRETWGVGTRPDQNEGCRDGIEYRADAIGLDEREDLPLYRVSPPDTVCLDDLAGRWRPSIHMPRWASRLTLEITGVRVERVQDIREQDAIAEGVDAVALSDMPRQATMTRRADFRQLWDTLNAKRGYGWDVNPSVWALSFRRVTA
jgi:hypothetical protein